MLPSKCNRTLAGVGVSVGVSGIVFVGSGVAAVAGVVAVGAGVAVGATVGGTVVSAGSLPQATAATVVMGRAKIARSRRMGWARVNWRSTLGTPLQLWDRGFLPQSPQSGTY